MQLTKNLRVSSFQIITGSFLVIILLGAFMLTLPVSSADGVWTPFGDALFTSTSAICVTGLVVQDTFRYWSLFGRLIILFLIQIGGLGTITLAVVATVLAGRKVSLFQRSILRDAVSADQVGGIARFALFILSGTLTVEFLGAAALFPVFLRKYPLPRSLFYSLFHSISAFCNAGFDLMGEEQPYSSLTGFTGSIPVNLIIMSLIVLGGLGFRTWEDIRANKLRLHKYRLQTKMILVTSAVLIFLPAIAFFIIEYPGLPLKERVLASLFQSVTTRTAGFNTTDYAQFTESGKLLSIILMLIGGSPGSTAGGMKTTTIAVLLLNAHGTFRHRDEASAFSRRISDRTVKIAATIFALYLGLFTLSAIIISLAESLPLLTCMFEAASAIGTVGLTLGITPQLSALSRGILIFLMYFGRVGGLTLIYAAVPSQRMRNQRLPLENVAVG
ncbi:MAG: Trk family potassium uptake protein [Lachnospiraceae bacterium]|nr:Trk family potassium uptake protein [Lachnospiraceae bacterium]